MGVETGEFFYVLKMAAYKFYFISFLGDFILMAVEFFGVLTADLIFLWN